MDDSDRASYEGPEDRQYTGAGDPFRSVLSDATDNIRPDFSPTEREKSDNKGREAEQPNQAAKNFLSGGESAASKTGGVTSGSASATATTRDGEENIKSGDSSFRFVGKGKSKKTPSRLGGKAFLKVGAPAIFIALALLFGGGGLIMLSSASLPFNFLATLTNNSDFLGTITSIRSKVKIVQQLASGTLTDKQRSKLENKGITVEDVDGGGTRLSYVEYDGDVKTVDASNFDAAYSSSTEFHNSYYEGSKTWSSSSGAWYDSGTGAYLKNDGFIRNNWSGFKEGDVAAEDSFKTKIRSDVDDIEIEGKTKRTETETDENGRVKAEAKEESVKLRSDLIETDDAGNVINASKLGDKLSEVVGNKVTAASIITNIGCTIFDVTTAIALLAAASQNVQVDSLINTYAEAIDKAKIGEGNTSPINEISNSLTRRVQKTYNYVDDNGNEVTKTKEGSAMEANAVGAAYSGTVANANDPSVRSFNIWSSIGPIASVLGVSMAGFTGCALARITTSAASAFLDLFTGGGATVFDLAIGVGAQLAIQGVVSVLVPSIATMLARDILSDIAGEDLGNALASGIQRYMGRNHQYSGGAVANAESLTSYYMEQDKVIADRARYDRTTLSPFDISSEYTFFGSLLQQATPLLAQTTSLTGAISTFGSTLRNSLTSLLPSASAASASIRVQGLKENTAKYCPQLDSIGGIGDAFCNPYFISDTSTAGAEYTFEDIQNTVAKLGDGNNFSKISEDGTPTINRNSNLGKYILYCGQRESAFGVADANISADFDISTGVSAVDAVLNATPVVDDLIDIASNVGKLANSGYISGESCVIGNDARDKTENIGSYFIQENSRSTSWGENKYYQRFIEDQRLAENMGIINRSSVTAFLEDYYKENPLDNSFEGVLARKSGLTKEQVTTALHEAEQIAFLQSYDPENYYPIRQDNQKATTDSHTEYGHSRRLLGDQDIMLYINERYVRSCQEITA